MQRQQCIKISGHYRIFLFCFQVAEINKASKQGELFSVFGSGTGGNSSLETKSGCPAEEDYLPASQVYSVSTGRIDKKGMVCFVCFFMILF